MPSKDEKMSGKVMIWGQEERDLLIRLDQRVADLQIAVKDIRDNTITHVEALERTKANRADLDKIQKNLDDNIELRVRSLEIDRVTQREHNILIGQVGKLEQGETKLFAWAAALAFVVSLAVTIIGAIINK